MVFKSLFQRALLEWGAWVRDYGVADGGGVKRQMEAVLRAHEEMERAAVPELDPDARMDRIAQWASSGGLTWTEAESLLELDATTPWRLPAR